MADLTRTYTGPLSRGRIDTGSRELRFERNVPVEVSADEAALLDSDPEWAAPKTKPKGTTPDIKES